MLSDEQGVFPLRAEATIRGIGGPSVVGVDIQLPSAGIDHRLHCDHHARRQHHPCALASDVRNDRILMEPVAYAMSRKITDHGIAVAVRMLHDGRADDRRHGPTV